MSIMVLNKHRDGPRDGITVYVGRPSTLGNPLVIGRDGSREEVVAGYERFLRAVMLMDCDIRDKVLSLVKMARNCDVNLVCHCAPLPCHADVIKRVIEELL